MPFSGRCSAAGGTSKLLHRKASEKDNVWVASRRMRQSRNIAVPGSGAFCGAPFPSPRGIDDSSTQGIIPRPFPAAVNAFYWASINSHAPTKQARILQAGRVIGYGIDSAALPDTLPTRWHRFHSFLAAAWRPEARFAKASASYSCTSNTMSAIMMNVFKSPSRLLLLLDHGEAMARSGQIFSQTSSNGGGGVRLDFEVESLARMLSVATLTVADPQEWRNGP